MANEELAARFTAYAAAKLRQHMDQLARVVPLLDPAEVWHRVNAQTNSVGNLLLHLTGNVQQWLLAGLAGEPFERDRPAEFAARTGPPADELLRRLAGAVARGCEIIARMTADELARERTIQGYRVTGLVAVFHVVEHFAGHTGQVVHMVKALRDVDLSSYDALGRRLDGDRGLP